jgi:hypothetical protein
MSQHRHGRVNAAWASANALLAIASGAWLMLGWSLRSECISDPECDDWVVADAVALAFTVVTLLLWLATGRRHRSLLAAGTAAMAVPAYHAVFV